MKTLAIIMALTLSQTGFRSAAETQALTRAAPGVMEFTPSASLKLLGLSGFRVTVCAESGQTLSGAGTLSIYMLDELSGLVTRNPGLDMSVTASGNRCQTFPDLVVAGSRGDGWMIAAATGITVSGGTTVTVRYRGYAAKGDQ